jgi:hypothetical protein
MFQNSYFEILAAISNPLNNFKVSIKKKKKKKDPVWFIPSYQ